MAKQAEEINGVPNAPSTEQEKELDSILRNEPSIVKLRDKDVKIYWLHNETKAKITQIFLDQKEDDDDRKVLTKASAAILLDSPNCYWTLTFLWGLVWTIKWRWMYYIKGYSDAELLPIITEGKKKVPVAAFLSATILLTEMRDTIMMMTRKEVRRYQAELLGGQLGQSQRNTPSSQNAE